MYAMTTSELTRYRHHLEHCLGRRDLPVHAPARALLAEQLADVLAEQEERARTGGPRAACRTWGRLS